MKITAIHPMNTPITPSLKIFIPELLPKEFLITFIPTMKRAIQRNMFILMPAEAEQSIEYNTFNKASLITRNNPDLQLVLHYGPGEQ